jgi:hypothetical protein
MVTITTETQRTLRGFSYDPIGRRRLDHKLSPVGVDSENVSSPSDHKKLVFGYERGLFIWRPLTAK